MSIFEPEQTRQISDIDPKIGYKVEDKTRICEALNYMWPKQRKQFF